MERVPRQNGLFEVSGEKMPFPLLIGRQCNICGFKMFPPQDYGCEQCGGMPDDLASEKFPGKGWLKSFAQLHNISTPSGGFPLVVGEVVLDDGPLIQAIIACEDTANLCIGMKVRGFLIESEKSGNELTTVDYYFKIDRGENEPDA